MLTRKSTNKWILYSPRSERLSNTIIGNYTFTLFIASSYLKSQSSGQFLHTTTVK